MPTAPWPGWCCADLGPSERVGGSCGGAAGRGDHHQPAHHHTTTRSTMGGSPPPPPPPTQGLDIVKPRCDIFCALLLSATVCISLLLPRIVDCCDVCLLRMLSHLHLYNIISILSCSPLSSVCPPYLLSPDWRHVRCGGGGQCTYRPFCQLQFICFCRD